MPAYRMVGGMYMEGNSIIQGERERHRDRIIPSLCIAFEQFPSTRYV